MNRRILLLRLDAIGDFILFTSILPALRNHFPEDHLVLIVHPTVAPLAKGCPYVDEVWSVDPAKYSVEKEYADDLIRHVRGKFDVAINTMYTRTDVSDNIIARSHAPVKIGFECTDNDGQEERRSREQSLYSVLIPSQREWSHEFKRYAQLLNVLGDETESSGLKPVLWLRDEEKTWVAEYLKQNLNGQQKYVVISPGAGSPDRYWNHESFALVGDSIAERYGVRILYVGSEQEQDLINGITKNMKSAPINLAGKLTLKQLAVMIAGADLLVGTESAGFHLAWASGVPTVGIVGGGHFGRFTPNLPHVRIAHVPMDCYYCYWHCIYDEIKCITSITPEMVMKEIEQVYRVEKEPV